MLTSTASEILEAFKSEKPVVLFLGQDYARTDSEVDPVLQALLSRAECKKDATDGWLAAFSGRPLVEDDYTWLTERFVRHIPAESVQQIFDFAWSAVFTTSIDPNVSRRLESRNRSPESVLAKDHYARVPRSRFRPAVHYLFGRSNETSPDYRSPRTELERRRRLSVQGNTLLNRLPETVTPIGLLVIAGYQPEKDWLALDDLLAPLSASQGFKVLWIGASQSQESVFLPELVQSGQLTLEERTFSQLVTEILIERESAALGDVGVGDEGTVSLPEGRFLQVSPSLRLRVEASAAMVDDSWTDDQVAVFGKSESEDFRRFHGEFGGPRALVEGIGRHFAITRDFELHLRNSVEDFIKNPGYLDSFVIVHGQSGTGKSISLARLARTLRVDGRVPVLYASDRIPSVTDIDEFASEVERQTALSTVIVCDANQPYEVYRQLANGLKSRGRRVVVVGTSYRIESPPSIGHQFIEAPAAVSKSELTALTKLINRHVPNDASIVSALSGDHVLGLLYRHLSVSRARIIGGISDEARFAERTIRIRAQNVPRGNVEGFALAAKLIEAGLGATSALFEDEADQSASGLDAPGRLIDYVMVAGRLDCPVPINLLMRALRSAQGDLDLAQIAYLFGELDLLRWKSADGEGNDLLVSPRLQLEAELICRRRLGDREKELDCIIELIEAVRPNSVDNDSELSFLLDLLHRLHRDGPRATAYEQGYLRIARALTTLREAFQVRDASLMLQESAFRRAALHVDLIADEPSHEILAAIDRDAILNEAREVVERALREIDDRKLRAGKKTRQNFIVERASIYGFLAVEQARRGEGEANVWSSYLAAKAAILSAMSVANNYFPLDIGVWAPLDILKAAKMPAARAAELKADILAVFDQAATDLTPRLSVTKLHERRMQVGRFFRDDVLTEDAYVKLKDERPSLAYYLRARAMCEGVFDNDEPYIDAKHREKAIEAAAFLEQYREELLGDARALHLLLQLKWASKTGTVILRHPRSPLPADYTFLSESLLLVRDLNNAAGDGARNSLRFLEATLEWLVADPAYARELFTALSHDTEFEDPSRIVRRLLLEKPLNGDEKFRGRIEKLRTESRWIVSVEGFGGTIDLLSRDFGSESLRPGREIRDFNIAFNFLGPIADPLSRQGARS
ncbi:ATP-binding protein [Paraburkholderia tropica]|uniref:ATP-binding protein n=1 Tax=Paraburkholderia tropica TaxID=92647 RepID=UPI002AB64DBB|nr:ATP-binding protein [Paraburkholderia tropica]